MTAQARPMTPPTSDHPTQLTLPSDREILIVRAFAAPRGLVFDAWCNPAYVPRWYGCTEMRVLSCEIDLREGGAWRWVTAMPDGSQHAHSGEYRTIDRPARLAFSERYEPIPGSEHEVTLTFTEQAGVTTMAMHLRYPSSAARDGHLQSGMQTGLPAMFDRLEQVARGAGAA